MFGWYWAACAVDFPGCLVQNYYDCYNVVRYKSISIILEFQLKIKYILNLRFQIIVSPVSLIKGFLSSEQIIVKGKNKKMTWPKK